MIISPIFSARSEIVDDQRTDLAERSTALAGRLYIADGEPMFGPTTGLSDLKTDAMSASTNTCSPTSRRQTRSWKNGDRLQHKPWQCSEKRQNRYLHCQCRDGRRAFVFEGHLR